MSLRQDRRTGRLICTCPQPRPQPVVLFDWLELTDVYECTDCWRPVLDPATHRGTELAHLGSEDR